MPPQIATVLFAVGIAGLFWLDRDHSVRTSKALWLPVIWLSIAGSRSPSPPGSGWAWQTEIPGQLPESSLLDQLLAGSLMLFGLIVLIRRGKEVTNLLKASWPIMLYFSFCLISLLWSDFPAWGFKRWVRALGDLIMVLIVATDAQPIAAFKRLFSRVGFVLLPASVLLIRYYPALGHGLGRMGICAQFIGVTTNKNVLGNLVYLIGLGALWQILSLVRDKEQPNRGRRLLAQCTLLAFGIYLLYTAHCATASGLLHSRSGADARHLPAILQASSRSRACAGSRYGTRWWSQLHSSEAGLQSRRHWEESRILPDVPKSGRS